MRSSGFALEDDEKLTAKSAGTFLPPVAAVESLPVEMLPIVANELAALHVAVIARLTVASPAPPRGHSTTEDHMVDIAEASRLTGMSRSWLYKQSLKLPFCKHIGRKLVFSRVGIHRWLSSRPR